MSQTLPTEMSSLTASAVPYDADDWEDWLRWDPTTESLSPNASSKDSNGSPLQDAAHAEQLPWLVKDETLALPMIVGDENGILDFSASMEGPSFAFTGVESVNPYDFEANNGLQPAVGTASLGEVGRTQTHWPIQNDRIPQGSAPLLSLATDMDRRQSASTTVVDSGESQRLSPASATQHYSSATSVSPHQAPAVPANPAKKKAGRKRKSEIPAHDSGDGEPPVKKTSHNVIEKRYRNNLNDKIQELRDSVPSLRAMSRPSRSDESEDLEGLAPAHKLNKSTVMAKATEYIKHLEKRNNTLVDEMTALKERLSSLERAYARSSSIQGQQLAASNSPVVARSRASSVHMSSLVQNGQLSNVPQDPRVQQQYMQQHSQPTYEPQSEPVHAQQQQAVNAQGGNGFVNRLMMGSMAGLMMMEGLHEHDTSGQGTSSRGLFAAPLHLFRRGDVQGHASPTSIHHAAYSLLKMALIFGALLSVILPLFKPKPRGKQQPIPHMSLAGAPSLAAPVEMRRKAWLTAIQSVWTPRPFLVEVVLVAGRMAELSLRRIVGFDRYAMLLGMSKEDEAARIKAWDIAIDAQLAGGDAEVSYYRLLLTIMASGTLPDSPIRLMQKAVHFRVFFWEIANAGYGNLFMFKDFTAKVAKIYWDSARAQQRAVTSGKASRRDELDHEIDLLPDHLAALVELDCDEVLTDTMIQRAYNLAWNRPSAENARTDSILDNVVEDHAIRSPLDAVAGWFANMIIDESLKMCLRRKSSSSEELDMLIELAAKTAPPASGTQTRAFVARAVLCDKERESNIAAALATIPSATLRATTDDKALTTMPMNVVDHIPVAADVRTALTLAKLLSIASPENPTNSHIHAACALSSIELCPPSTTLLTAVASLKVMESFTGDPLLFSYGKLGLDEIARCLRLWIGSRMGKATGLGRADKSHIVASCLDVAKKVGGWRDDEEEVDSGYISGGRSRRPSGDIGNE